MWNLAAPSGGSILDSDGNLVPHFRWAGKNLFGLTPGLKGVIAAAPRHGTTLFFSDIAYTNSDPVPPRARGSIAYSELGETEFPCVGSGWRKGPSRSHSSNDAAARVLKLNPNRPVSITQVDYMAISASGELLLGTHVQYQGSSNEGTQRIDAYWHFLKLPRLADDASAAGYTNP